MLGVLQRGRDQSSQSDVNLETPQQVTAQQDAWQLFTQGNGPMHVPQGVPLITSQYSQGNATAGDTSSSAAVMLSHNVNGEAKSGDTDSKLNR